MKQNFSEALFVLAEKWNKNFQTKTLISLYRGSIACGLQALLKSKKFHIASVNVHCNVFVMIWSASGSKIAVIFTPKIKLFYLRYVLLLKVH